MRAMVSLVFFVFCGLALGGAAFADSDRASRDDDRIREVREDRVRDREDDRARERDDRTDNSARDSSGSGPAGSQDDASSSGSSSGSGSSGASGSSGSGSSGSSGSNSGSSSGNDDDVTSHGGEVIAVDRDAHGHERRSGEVLFVGAPTQVRDVRQQGYEVIDQHELGVLGEVIARVRVRPEQSIERAIENIRAIAPSARVAPNALYRPSGGEVVSTGASAGVTRPVQNRGHVGIIDTGVDTAEPGLRGMVSATAAFGSGAYQAREHGTIVALLAAGAGMRLSSADVFDVDQQGAPVASALAIARALDWMAVRDVRVVNISIQGPPDVIVEAVIRRAQARGVVVVAAVGNDGPHALPAYPAAYRAVIGVTAVNQQGDIFWRANRGPGVDFAAIGVGLEVAVGGEAVTVSGTSFAAPRVAAEAVIAAGERAAEQRLRSRAIDLGTPGRDDVFGWGWIDH